MSAFSTVLNVASWDVSKVKFMKPRVNDGGKGKTIGLLSTQTNTKLMVSTPRMKSYGIAAFTDPKTGICDNKFTLSLQFPHESESTEEIQMFLEKLKAFEKEIIAAAAKNSESWWDKSKSLDSCADSFTSCIKYPKDESKRTDYSRPPTIRGKVYQSYQKKDSQLSPWDIEIFNENRELVFPTEETRDEHPKSFVLMHSQVAAVLQCTSIWIVGANWGVTWKVNQVLVSPPESFAPRTPGKCMIAGGPVAAPAPAAPKKDEVAGVIVDDSDDEAEAPTVAAPAPVAPAPEAEEPPTEEEPAAAAAAAAPAPAVKKTVVKKTVVKKA